MTSGKGKDLFDDQVFEVDVMDLPAYELEGTIGSSMVMSSICPQYSSSLQGSSIMATGLAKYFGLGTGTSCTTMSSSLGGVVCFGKSGFDGCARWKEISELRLLAFKASKRVSIAFRRRHTRSLYD